MLVIAAKKRRSNINVPQVVGQQASGGYYRSATASLIFANPMAALTIIAVILASLMIVGGLSLELFIGLLLNPWSWAIALIIGMLTQPETNTVIGFSIIVGFAFWGWGIYQDYTALPQICSVPIIGWIACGAWNIVTFIPKLFMLSLNILTAFIQIWMVSFIKDKLTR